MPGQDAAVLVVEDNATNRVAIGALLDHFGVSHDFASTGHEAVAAIQVKHYRLVLMDLILPGIDGFEATRRVRRLEYGAGRHTPIVAVTAVEPVLGRETCISAGMDGFIAKPIDIDALTEVLAKWMKRRGDKDSSGSGSADIARILESFLEATSGVLADLNTAIASEDLRTASHLAHEVRASGLVVHAEEVAQTARRLERAIGELDWRKVLERYLDLTAAFRRATDELERSTQASSNLAGAQPTPEKQNRAEVSPPSATERP